MILILDSSFVFTDAVVFYLIFFALTYEFIIRYVFGRIVMFCKNINFPSIST